MLLLLWLLDRDVDHMSRAERIVLDILGVIIIACIVALIFGACRTKPRTEWVFISEVNGLAVTVICEHGVFYLDGTPKEIAELLTHRGVGDSVHVEYDREHIRGGKFNPSAILR